jgi:hypothetical protein
MKLRDFLSLTDQGIKSGLISDDAEISFLAGKNESPVTSFGFVDGNVLISFTLDAKLPAKVDKDVFEAPPPAIDVPIPTKVLPPPKSKPTKTTPARARLKLGPLQTKVLRALEEKPGEKQTYRTIEARLNAFATKKNKVAYETIIGTVKRLKTLGVVDIEPSKTKGHRYDISLRKLR